jgi:16S rRNA (guanine966-N2)-methyltransferase
MKRGLRVVAGAVGGRRIEVPPGTSVRPTSDRVREATFNALESLGAVEGASVLDLFAGSGALGIEALSRGATRATFVESRRDVARVAETNLERLGLADRARVVVSEAERFLADLTETYDLALLDPPYEFDGWDELLRAVPAPLVVVESDRPVLLPPDRVVVRQKRYGGTLVTIVGCSEPTPGDQP